jgi:hypothetical protein
MQCQSNYERRQSLNYLVIWDGSIDRFEVFRNNFEEHYGRFVAGYFFDTEFQTAYFERDIDIYVDFLDKVPSLPRRRKIHLYCRNFMENRNKQDGIRV